MITDQERTEGDALCGSINDKFDLEGANWTWCETSMSRDGCVTIHFGDWGQWCCSCRFFQASAAIEALQQALQEADVAAAWRRLRTAAGYIRTVQAKRPTFSN